MVNLGSPDSTNNEDVRDYLDEFLMDERVIDLPKWFRTFLVKGIILKTRPKKSAEAYRKIWWDEGSPLIVLSKKLQEKVQKKVSVVAMANWGYKGIIRTSVTPSCFKFSIPVLIEGLP